MGEQVQISVWVLGVVGAFISVLLAMIAAFLNRLLGQVDGLSKSIAELNATMIRIDGDLTGELGVLKEKYTTLFQRVTDMDELWGRIRGVEEKTSVIAAAGCDIVNKHCHKD